MVSAGNFATDAHVVGAAMAVGIGFAMQVPALVLFSLVAVGSAANVTGGAGGPLAVLFIAIIAAWQVKFIYYRQIQIAVPVVIC